MIFPDWNQRLLMRNAQRGRMLNLAACCAFALVFLSTAGYTQVLDYPRPTEVVTPDTAANLDLLTAIRKNDLEAVRKAFAKGANPNATLGYHFERPPSGFQPENPIPFLRMVSPRQRHDADRPEAIAIFRMFLEHGADVKKMDADGENAVLWAAWLQDIKLVRMVLDKGADIQAKRSLNGGNVVNSVVGQTLPDHEEHTIPLAKLVLERGADPNVYDNNGNTPLHTASEYGFPRLTELLLKHGADPSLETRPASTGGTYVKRTALILAQRSGSEKVVRLLTIAKKSLTAVEAATTGNATALKPHLDAGMSANSKDENGSSFLWLAAASGNEAAVRLLLERGADPNAVDAFGNMPLHRAASLGHLRVVRLLLDHKADINAVKGSPQFPLTALTEAVRAAEADMVALLLQRGVDLNAPGNRNALEVLLQNAGQLVRRRIGQKKEAVKRGQAALNAQNDIYEMLSAKIDVQRWGGNAVCKAVVMGQYSIAEDLIIRGADVNSRDPKGKPLLVLIVEQIRSNRSTISAATPEMQKLVPVEIRRDPQEIKEMQAQAAANDKVMVAFLKFLLARKPDLKAHAPAQVYRRGEAALEMTALDMARYLELKDIAALLEKSAARR